MTLSLTNFSLCDLYEYEAADNKEDLTLKVMEPNIELAIEQAYHNTEDLPQNMLEPLNGSKPLDEQEPLIEPLYAIKPFCVLVPFYVFKPF